MDLHYFGTSTSEAGHYFWILKDNLTRSSPRTYFKDLPFNPEGIPLSKVKGSAEAYIMVDIKRNKTYCIMAICGSPVDNREGCKSVFWIDGGDMQILNDLIRQTPAAMAIINKMPFKIEGFKNEDQQSSK